MLEHETVTDIHYYPQAYMEADARVEALKLELLCTLDEEQSRLMMNIGDADGDMQCILQDYYVTTGIMLGAAGVKELLQSPAEIVDKKYLTRHKPHTADKQG